MQVHQKLLGAVLVSLAAACVTAPPPKPPPPPPPDPEPSAPKVRMAVLPVESDAYPRLAAELNLALDKARMSPVQEYMPFKVSLEVVQLQTECVDKTDQCFGAAGRSLEVNYVLAGEVSNPKKTRKGASPGITFSVLLFDVDHSTTLKLSERSTRTEDDALRQVSEVMSEVLRAAPHPDAGH